MKKNKIALAIHGGAGTILRSAMTAELEAEYRRGLQNALQKGWEILQKNGAALDAVEAATVELENFPLFNAGRGAVFTHDGKNELDASIMDGANLKAGAVACVKNVKNPVKLARLVMEKTAHILLAGDGANEFARQMKVEFEPDEYFFTDFRYQQFLKAKKENIVELDHSPVAVELIETDVEVQKTQTERSPNPKSKIPNP
ncbi:MAG: isoaspartyl peptidase/L-asparaginase family protein, partial [Pyrinomonadaceae bacterium]